MKIKSEISVRINNCLSEGVVNGGVVPFNQKSCEI